MRRAQQPLLKMILCRTSMFFSHQVPSQKKPCKIIRAITGLVYIKYDSTDLESFHAFIPILNIFNYLKKRRLVTVGQFSVKSTVTMPGCTVRRGQAHRRGHKHLSEFSPVGHRFKLTSLGRHQKCFPSVCALTKIEATHFCCTQVFLGDSSLLALPGPVPAVQALKNKVRAKLGSLS